MRQAVRVHEAGKVSGCEEEATRASLQRCGVQLRVDGGCIVDQAATVREAGCTSRVGECEQEGRVRRAARAHEAGGRARASRWRTRAWRGGLLQRP